MTLWKTMDCGNCDLGLQRKREAILLINAVRFYSTDCRGRIRSFPPNDPRKWRNNRTAIANRSFGLQGKSEAILLINAVRLL